MQSSCFRQRGDLELLENIEQELGIINSVAQSGYNLAINYTFSGAQIFRSTMDELWLKEYETNGYYLKDPVVLWCATSTGDIRWSEMQFPDYAGVLKKAECIGMKFGANFSRKVDRYRSALVVAREDRSLSDCEMAAISNAWDRILNAFQRKPILTQREIDVLKQSSLGKNIGEIAEALNVSVQTVKFRLSKIRAKLGSRTVIEAVVSAVRLGYIQ